jgi:iron(III) transport system permease protein
MRARSLTVERARAAFLLLVCAAPLGALVLKGVPHCADGTLAHLLSTVVPMQTLLSLLTSTFGVLLGAVLASGGVLCGLCSFPGRQALQNALLVPMLMPTWFLAVLYEHVLGISGPFALVAILGIASAPLFQLLATAALRAIPSPYLETLQHLGRGGVASALPHLLPFALPAAAAAAILAFLLAWGDAASARTLAVAPQNGGRKYKLVWRPDDGAGAPIAVGFLVVSLAPAAVLWAWIARRRFRGISRVHRHPMGLIPLRGVAVALPWLLGAPLLVAGVIFPWTVVGAWAFDHIDRVSLETLGVDLAHTLVVATFGTAFATAVALALLRQEVAAESRTLVRVTASILLATFAIPPIVLALAFLWLLPEDRGWTWAAWLNATPLPLLAAVGLRFSGTLLVAGKAGLTRVARVHADVLRVSGRTGSLSFIRLFRPFLSGSMAVAACFAFLESLKDVSLSLVLQPFGFTTLAGRVFQYSQTQRIPECALWIVCVALAGIYPLRSLARIAEGAELRTRA